MLLDALFESLLLKWERYFLLFFLFFFWAVLHNLWDLSSLIRDWTLASTVKAWNLNHQATRELLDDAFNELFHIFLNARMILEPFNSDRSYAEFCCWSASNWSLLSLRHGTTQNAPVSRAARWSRHPRWDSAASSAWLSSRRTSMRTAMLCPGSVSGPVTPSSHS